MSKIIVLDNPKPGEVIYVDKDDEVWVRIGEPMTKTNYEWEKELRDKK